MGLGRWSLHLSSCPSHLFFLSVTAALVPQGLPVCLLGGRQTLTLNPSVAWSLSLPRGSEWGRGHAGDLGSASGSSLQACDAQLSGRTCLEGMGSPFPWGRSCERGLTCTQETEGSLIPNSGPVSLPTRQWGGGGAGDAEGAVATLWRLLAVAPFFGPCCFLLGSPLPGCGPLTPWGLPGLSAPRWEELSFQWCVRITVPECPTCPQVSSLPLGRCLLRSGAGSLLPHRKGGAGAPGPRK